MSVGKSHSKADDLKLVSLVNCLLPEFGGAAPGGCVVTAPAWKIGMGSPGWTYYVCSGYERLMIRC
jgi:hypothetical protein